MIGKYIADRYEIIEKIGDGGMSEVYRAKCHVLNRQVAVKILKHKFIEDADLVKRFDSEAKAAASIQHPNIVNIFDVGVEDNIHYIVMELLSNDTLKDYIAKHDGFINSQEIAKIGLQIAEGLAIAHDMGIIHRDIKPQNILMCGQSKLKVADFGIAHAVNGSVTRNAGEVIGSVSYASPEQSRGGYIDQRTDIYSLGVLLYELATNQVPFEGDVPVTVALKHLKEAPIPPSKINPDINTDLEKIILKCLQKLPDQRYQAVEFLMNDLRALIKGEDVALKTGDLSTAVTRVMPAVVDEIEITGEEHKEIDPKKGFVIAAVLGLLTAIIVLAIVFLPKYQAVTENPTFALPSVIGLDLQEAEQKLKQAGLNVIVEKSIMSDLENNHIVVQSPKVGTMVKAGQDIIITPSLGQMAPDLFGKDFASAEVELKSQEITLLKTGEAYSDQKAGVIISQNIKAGTAIKKGDEIEVVISLGDKKSDIVTMPELIGKTEAEAKALLKHSDLQVGEIEYDYNDARSGDVYEQSIPAGVRVSVDSAIDFSVSQGKEINVTSSGEDESENQQNGEVTTTAEATSSQRTFYIPLGTDKDIYIIKVVAVGDNGEKVLHNKIHKREEESAAVTLTGKGDIHLRFYKDDVLIRDEVVDFGGE